MKSHLAEVFDRYPAVVLKRGQTTDDLSPVGRTLVIQWEQAVEGLSDDFLSSDDEQRNSAISLSLALSGRGNDCAVEALERAIRRKRGGRPCEFYECPSGARAYDNTVLEAEAAELIELAEGPGLWSAQPAEVQRLISHSAIIKCEADELQGIQERAGWEQAVAFQLLATHLAAKARLVSALAT